MAAGSNVSGHLFAGRQAVREWQLSGVPGGAEISVTRLVSGAAQATVDRRRNAATIVIDSHDLLFAAPSSLSHRKMLPGCLLYLLTVIRDLRIKSPSSNSSSCIL